MDDISERICAVIDSAEFCRNVHTDPRYIESSEKVFYMLTEYISMLNTTTDIYDSLVKVYNSPDWDKMTFEDKMVVSQLKLEFELHGINKTDQEKQEIIEIQNNISKYGDKFVNERTVYMKEIDVPLKSVENAPNHLKNNLKKKLLSNQKVKLFPSIEWLGYVDDPSSREKIYKEINKPINLSPLIQLLKNRSRFANLIGFPSFAHQILNHRVYFLYFIFILFLIIFLYFIF